MKFNKKIIALLAAGLLSQSINAAYFILPDDDGGAEQAQMQGGYAVETQAHAQSQVVQQSSQPSKMAVPLTDALRMVVPAKWRGYADPTIDPNFPVLVNVYPDWQHSLRELSERYNLIFTINKKKKRVYATAGNGGLKDMSNANYNAGIVGEVPKPGSYETTQNGQPYLKVLAGQRLPDALDSFLSSFGMKMVWDSASQPVLRDQVQFNGPIDQILTQLLSPLGFHATIYKQGGRVVIRSASEVADKMRKNEEF